MNLNFSLWQIKLSWIRFLFRFGFSRPIEINMTKKKIGSLFFLGKYGNRKMLLFHFSTICWIIIMVMNLILVPKKNKQTNNLVMVKYYLHIRACLVLRKNFVRTCRSFCLFVFFVHFFFTCVWPISINQMNSMMIGTIPVNKQKKIIILWLMFIIYHYSKQTKKKKRKQTTTFNGNNHCSFFLSFAVVLS